MKPMTASHAVRRGDVTCFHINTVISAYKAHTTQEKMSLGFDTGVCKANEIPNEMLSRSKPSRTKR